MMTRSPIVTAILVFCGFGQAAFPSRPAEWFLASQEEFLKGDSRGVSITSDGRLVLAPQVETVLETGEALVHAAVMDKAGNIFVATGSNGRIFRISASGQTQLWADLEENGVFGLAVDSSNRLYAATGPEGKVYRLDNQGKAEVFYNPKVKYCWDLAVDSNNNLYLATGPEGVVYQIDPQGNGSEYFDSKETHVVSLGWDLNGNLLIGTAPGGLLIRVTGGRAFVLYDSALAEIKNTATDRYGNIFAIGLGSSTAAQAESVTPKAASGNVATGGSSGSGAAESAVEVEGSKPGGKLEVYKVGKDHLVEVIYSDDASSAYDLLVQNDGSILIGTGGKGRILAVTSLKMLKLLAQVQDEQVTALIGVGDTVYAASSNLGKVYRLQAKPEAKGVFESQALDAKILSDWGRLRWEVEGASGTPPVFFTRSGNTEKPDETWSEWDGPHTDPAGSSIQSPPARYLQWKVEFRSDAQGSITSDSNAVTGVGVSYLQRNMKPSVTKLTVFAPGAALVKLPTASAQGGAPVGGPDGAHERSLPDSVRLLGKTPDIPPREGFLPGARSFSWSAGDPNGDDLVFSLSLRRKGERAWRRVVGDLGDAFYTLDSASWPDGVYSLKVEASDRPSNPASTALSGELVSKEFVIANSLPILEIEVPEVEGTNTLLRATARTAASRVFQVEYSLDARNWIVVFPTDGIADGQVEQYEVRLENLVAGEHSVLFRVIDTIGNLGTGRAVFTIR